MRLLGGLAPLEGQMACRSPTCLSLGLEDGVQATDDETFGNLILGDRSGQPRGLLDEVFAFRRPLALDEVQLLWKLGVERR